MNGFAIRALPVGGPIDEQRLRSFHDQAEIFYNTKIHFVYEQALFSVGDQKCIVIATAHPILVVKWYE